MLKVKLDALNGRWTEELPNMLWSYRTTTRTSKGKTPFFLAFDIKAVISLEIKIPSFHMAAYDDEENQMTFVRN